MLPSARTRIIVFSAAWLTGLFLLLPGLIAIPVSLNDSRFIAMPQHTLSLRHFEALLSGTWLSSMGESAIISLVTTAISVFLGTAASIRSWRLSGPRPLLSRP